jgi:NAD(P)-dependent dehydrogenase (short-subunit alcohol dehydrogenase family)
VIGGSSGIGLETARQAHAAGAAVILTGRDPERLKRAGLELDALSTMAFDATDAAALERFLKDLPNPIDHLMVAAGTAYYVPLPEIDFGRARRAFDEHLWLPLQVARSSADKVRAGGTLVFITGTGAHSSGTGLSIMSTLAAGLHALVANLAVELAPVRANLIAAGFVDTPLSAALLGDEIEERREQLRATLPIRRVVGSEDVAALALHLMTNTALTGATYDVDGGQQLL